MSEAGEMGLNEWFTKARGNASYGDNIICLWRQMVTHTLCLRRS